MLIYLYMYATLLYWLDHNKQGLQFAYFLTFFKGKEYILFLQIFFPKISEENLA